MSRTPEDGGSRGAPLAPGPAGVREDHLPAPLDRPAGEQGGPEIAAAGRMDHCGVERVVVAQRPGNPPRPALVHLLERQDVRLAKAVALEHFDGAIDLAGELDVEGDDPDEGIGGRARDGTGRMAALEPGAGETQQVGGRRARAQHQSHRESGNTTAEPRRTPERARPRHHEATHDGSICSGRDPRAGDCDHQASDRVRGATVSPP